MTIGNLASEARTKPSLNTSVLLCLLPIPQKMQEMTAGMKKRFQTEHRRIFTEILSHILRCLNLSDDEGAFYSLCTDGNTRVCYLRLAAWIADYPEHITIQGLAYGVCQWCEVPKKMLGNCPKRNQRPAKRRNHAEYARRWTKGTEKDDDWLTEHGVRPAENTLWWLKYCDLADFPKPDILHTLLLGMFKHLLTWLHAMLKQHGRMQRFDTIWLKVPAYLEMGSPKKRYSEVSQWQGKEIKTMCRFLYCVTVAALDAPKASEKQSFSDAIQATKALIEILMFSTYRSHDAETIDMLHEAVVRFHDHKNVFLQYRAGIKVSKDATDRRKELNAERDAELAITTSAAEKKRIRQAWATFIEWEMRATLEENSHFNFPKLHMLQHWAEQIRRFGNIPQWDTNTGEAAHKMVKEGYRMSNRSGDYTLQILRHNMKTVAFSMRELNNTARGRKIVQVKTNFEQKDDDPVILPSESLDPSKAPAQFIGPYMPTGRSAINTVRKVIKNANVPCFDAAYQEYVTDVRQEEWNEHHYMNAAAVLYSGIELYMQQFATGNWEIRRMRCTASRKWHGGAPRADWVWLDLGLAKTKTSERRQRRQPAGLYGALQGRIPCKLRCLFKVALPNADGRIVDEHLALVEVVYPLQNGNVDNNTGLVTVVRPDPENPHHRGFMGQLEEGVTYRVFPACDIVGPAHLIPLQAENTTSWLINPHIDIQTWNTVY